MKKTITNYFNPHIKIKWNPLGKRWKHVLLTVLILNIVHVAMAQQSTTTPAKAPSTTAPTPTPTTVKTAPPTTTSTVKSTTATTAPLAGKKTPVVTAKPTIKPIVYEKPFVLSLTAGTTGLGIEAKKMLDYNLGLRAGFSFFPELSTVRDATEDFNNSNKYSGNFSKAQILLQYQPFKSVAIQLVGGGAYVFALQTTIDKQATGNYTYGDIVFTPAEIGTVHTVADWKGPAAYLGLSFFKIVPTRRFNITVDLGTYYLSDPKTSITGTNLLAVNASESNQINWHEDISQYRWLPVLQVNYNFKLGKIKTKQTNKK